MLHASAFWPLCRAVLPRAGPVSLPLLPQACIVRQCKYELCICTSWGWGIVREQNENSHGLLKQNTSRSITLWGSHSGCVHSAVLKCSGKQVGKVLSTLMGHPTLAAPLTSHQYSAPAGVAAQGQGDVQEDDEVADSEDGQVLGCCAVDLILQGALWTHTRPAPLTQGLGQRALCA